MIAVGFPTVYKDRSYLEDCTVPRIFVQSTHDQYGPISELEPLVASLPEPKKLILVEADGSLLRRGAPGTGARNRRFELARAAAQQSQANQRQT